MADDEHLDVHHFEIDEQPLHVSSLTRPMQAFRRLPSKALRRASHCTRPMQASTQESDLCASFLGDWHQQRLVCWRLGDTIASLLHLP